MPTILGIESTAHTFGIGVVHSGKILSNIREMYTTESGGIIPTESAKHHIEIAEDVYERSVKEAGIKEEDIDAIAFSQGPGLAPCLIEGMKFAKELSKKLNALPSRSKGKGTSKPIIPVNHCVAHLEIGKITGAKDPVLLYCSGANTQVIAYASGKYRVFGETLDIGVGNFIDTIGRFMGLGFPAGPKIQELASRGKNFIELPYKVKGMDVAFSGIQTKLKQLIEKLPSHYSEIDGSEQPSSCSSLKNNMNDKKNLRAVNQPLVNYSADNSKRKNPMEASDFVVESNKNKLIARAKSREGFEVDNHRAKRGKLKEKINTENLFSVSQPRKPVVFGAQKSKRFSLTPRTQEVCDYTKEDLAFSLQETVFAMLVETAERALAHTGKKELLLGGGVACNSRLQEMCKIMCEERGCKFFVPSRDLLTDNGAMIAYLGEIMFKAGIKKKNLDKVDIKPRERTDDVVVGWR